MDLREPTTFDERWRSDAPMFGGWVTSASSLHVELLARSGFDWLALDMQHGFFGTDGTLGLLQILSLTGVPTFVRPEWHDPGQIMKALDAGATGVVPPMVSNAVQARQVAGATRYPPMGYRSFGPTRAHLGAERYSTEKANSKVRCIVMIETLEGVERIDEILSVPGVDGAFVGPSDLSLSGGFEPRMDCDEPEHLDRINSVLEACHRHDVMPGIYAGNVDLAKRWSAAGFRMIALAADATLLTTATTSALRSLREG